MSIVDKVKGWFAKQESYELRVDQAEGVVQDGIDRVSDHKDHMIDRVEQIDTDIADQGDS